MKQIISVSNPLYLVILTFLSVSALSIERRHEPRAAIIITNKPELRETTTSANEDDQTLVETNNILSSPPAASGGGGGGPSSPPSWPLDLKTYENNIIPLNALGVATKQAALLEPTTSTTGPPNLQITTPQRDVKTCELAQAQCSLRKACGPALQAYTENCQDLFNNKTNICSPKCLLAMIALRSTEQSDDLANCDCMGNERCLQSRLRERTCQAQVEEALKPSTIVSCSTASWICLSDQSCLTALGFYYTNCGISFQQRHCSARCNNSLTILYRQAKAAKLTNCICDGSEEFPCLRYKTYTQRLCLNKLTPSADQLMDFDSNQASSSLSPSGDDDGEATADSSAVTEEDSFNMTNDPESFEIMGSSTGGDCADGYAGDPDSVDMEGDEKVAAGDNSGAADAATDEEESSSTTFNGIQWANFNWIPLVGGRYFTNLQHQKKSSQRRQQHLTRQQSPTSKYNEHLPAPAQFQQDQILYSDQHQHSTGARQKSNPFKSNHLNNGHYDPRKRSRGGSRFYGFLSSSATTSHKFNYCWLLELASCLVVYMSSHTVLRRLY